MTSPITDLIDELRFASINFRQLAETFEDGPLSKGKREVLSGGCEGWANRIDSLLERVVK